MAAARRTGARRPHRTVGWVAAVAAVAVTAAGLALSRRGGEAATVPRAVDVDFDGYRFGAVPREFAIDPAGPFDRPSWRVYTDPFAPSPGLVLVRAAPASGPDRYSLALLRDVTVREFSASVFVKPMAGGTDISGGLAWSVGDQDTFHAALADARSRQLRILSVATGTTTVLATAPIPIDIEYERANPTSSHGWFGLRVEVSAGRITAWFADRQVIALDDPAPTLGSVGLLTRGDSVVAFDSFSVRFQEPR